MRNSDTNPILIFPDLTFEDLQRIVEYIYVGELTIAEDSLDGFMLAAETLRLKGVSLGEPSSSQQNNQTNPKQNDGTSRFEKSSHVLSSDSSSSSSSDEETAPSAMKKKQKIKRAKPILHRHLGKCPGICFRSSRLRNYRLIEAPSASSAKKNSKLQE